MTTFKHHSSIFLRGFCMGVADLIPGVSGGTIAFITGIYANLLGALSVFSTAAFWQALLRLQFKTVFKLLDWQFLLALFLGLLTAILTMSKLLHYLLITQTQFLLGFFFGLVIASALFLWRQLSSHSAQTIALVVVMAALTFAVVSSGQTSLPTTPVVLFFCGMLAISAMLLPGISGSYILLILGVYPTVIAAIHERDIIVLLVFAAGCGTGLLLFSRLLFELINRYYATTMAVLIGVMIGALPKIWPWKAALDDKKIILADNVLPNGSIGEIIGVVVLAVVGFAIVFMLEKINRNINDTH